MVVTVGRLDYQKGQEFLIQAHGKLLEKGIEHNLVILGEGDELEPLRALSDRLGVAESVFFFRVSIKSI